MSTKDFDHLTIMRTRTGPGQGDATERQMLDAISDTGSFRTRAMIHPDGSQTRMKTKGGMPEFITDPAPTETSPSFSYEIVGETVVDHTISGWQSNIRAFKLTVTKAGGTLSLTRVEIPIEEYRGDTGTEWKKYHRNLRWKQPSTGRFLDYRTQTRLSGFGPSIAVSVYNAFWGEPFIPNILGIGAAPSGASWFDLTYSGSTRRVVHTLGYYYMDTGVGASGVGAGNPVTWPTFGYQDYAMAVYSPAAPRVQYAAGVYPPGTPYEDRLNGVHRWDENTETLTTLFTENASGDRGVTYKRVSTGDGTSDTTANTSVLSSMSYRHDFPVGVDVSPSGEGRAITMRISSSGSAPATHSGEGHGNVAGPYYGTSTTYSSWSEEMKVSFFVGDSEYAPTTVYSSANDSSGSSLSINVTTTTTAHGTQTYSPKRLAGSAMSHPEARVAALFSRVTMSNPTTYINTHTYLQVDDVVEDNTYTYGVRSADINEITALVVDMKSGRETEIYIGKYTSGPSETSPDVLGNYIVVSAGGVGVMDTYGGVFEGTRYETYVPGYNGNPTGWMLVSSSGNTMSGMMDPSVFRDGGHGPNGMVMPATIWANDDVILFSGRVPYASFADENNHFLYVIDRSNGATKKFSGLGSYWKFYEALKKVPV